MTEEQKQLELQQPALTKAQTELLVRALQAIRGMGCEAIVRLPDGTKRETEGWKKPTAPKTGRKEVHKKGEIRDYVLGFLKDMQPGESRMIPIGPYRYQDIQAAAMSHGQNLYGKGNATSTRRRDKGAVEFLYTLGI